MASFFISILLVIIWVVIPSFTFCCLVAALLNSQSVVLNDVSNDATQFVIIVVAFTSTFAGKPLGKANDLMVKVCVLVIAGLCYALSSRYLVKYLKITSFTQIIFNLICDIMALIYLYNMPLVNILMK